MNAYWLCGHCESLNLYILATNCDEKRNRLGHQARARARARERLSCIR